MPTHAPEEVKAGPPELPELIAASICEEDGWVGEFRFRMLGFRI
jgi:hypothetical protein